MAAAQLQVPTWVEDNYTVYSKIGQGAFGDVIRAKPKTAEHSAEWRAVKIVIRKLIPDNDVLRCIQQEAEMMKRFNHWGVLKLFNCEEKSDGIFLEMEYCSNGDLAKVIREQKGKPFTAGQIRNWFVQLAMAVQALHVTYKVVHRDINPRNILLSDDKMRVKLGGFGISQELNDAKRSNFRDLTIGTFSYMSPQALNANGSTFADDIWSLGVVLYELATLGLPFLGSSALVVLKQIARANITEDICGKITGKHLQDLLSKMLDGEKREKFGIGQVVGHEFLRNAPVHVEHDELLTQVLELKKKIRDLETEQQEGTKRANDLQLELSDTLAESQKAEQNSQARNRQLEAEIAKLQSACRPTVGQEKEFYTACLHGDRPVVESYLDGSKCDPLALINTDYNKRRHGETMVNDGWYMYNNETCLHPCCLNGQDSIVELILAAKLRLEQQQNGLDKAQAMQVLGKFVNQQNGYGSTALQWASANGKLNCVKLLCEFETADNGGPLADVNIKNNDEWTALMVAAYHNHVEVKKFLISKGAKGEREIALKEAKYMERIEIELNEI